MRISFLESYKTLWLAAILSLVVLILLIVQPAHATPRANVIVTNTNDSGAGSLRDAIAIAAPGDTIIFDLPLPATITLSSQLSITKSLTISGTGAPHLTISGGGSTRVLFIDYGGMLTISDLTIANGYAAGVGGGILNFATLTVTNGIIYNNTATSNGGGIYNDTGTMATIVNSEIYSNSASSGAGIYDYTNSIATVISNSAIYSNTATFGAGGMLHGFYASLTITDSVFHHNNGHYAGGGLINYGIATITNSVFQTNTAMAQPNSNGTGGAIWNEGTLILTQSTISGNRSSYFGGGIVNELGHNATISGTTIYSNTALTGGGGGIINFATLTVMNSTIASNLANSYGGGVANGGNVTFTNSTIADNITTGDGGGILRAQGTVALLNTIVSNNTDSSGGNCSGTITNVGHNLENGTSCAWASNNGSLSSTNPFLGPLQNNGGTTLTHALLPGSPAINSGDNNGCPSTDQRGYVRPIGVACDIGAVEFPLVYYFPLVFR